MNLPKTEAYFAGIVSEYDVNSCYNLPWTVSDLLEMKATAALTCWQCFCWRGRKYFIYLFRFCYCFFKLQLRLSFCLKSGKIMDLNLSYFIIKWMGFLNTDDRGIKIFICLELYWGDGTVFVIGEKLVWLVYMNDPKYSLENCVDFVKNKKHIFGFFLSGRGHRIIISSIILFNMLLLYKK